MPLTLSLTGGEIAPGQRQTRTLRSGTLSIGRAPGNDWVLADPERYLSKTHCIISADDGRYVLTDTSSNGIFVNGAQRPTQRDSQVVLHDGDQLRISTYVITVTEIVDMAPAGRDHGGGLAPHGGRETDGPLNIDPLDDPLGRAPDPAFRHPIAHMPAPGRGDDPFDMAGERERRSADDDLFRGTAPANAWKGPTQSDHAAPLSHAFTAPKTIPPANPADIDFDALIGDLGQQSSGVTAWTPLAPPAAPQPQAERQISPDPDDWLPAQPAPVAAPAARPPPAAPLQAPPAAAAVVPPPAPPAAQNTFAEADDWLSAQPGPATAPAPHPPAAHPPAAHPPAAHPPAAPPAAAGAPSADAARALLAAFLAGAGVPDLHIDSADPEATLRAVGEVFRVMAGGLREVLMSRAAIKGEMRVEQTMISARNNNALKFSATTDEAVASLLRSRGPGYLPPLAAAQQAFDDIKSHEIAVVSGVQTALVALLRRFDPDALEGRLGRGMLDAVLPGARKARYWDAFRQTYGTIAREAEDDFQAVFGREFAQAYIAQTRKD